MRREEVDLTLREAVDILDKTFYITLLVILPLLGTGLVIGVTVAIFQSVTQVQEMTLTFIPKLLGVIGVTMYLMPWIGQTIMDFTVEVFSHIIPP